MQTGSVRSHQRQVAAGIGQAVHREVVGMKTPSVVSSEEWHAAREELLVKEKELTRARDALAAERRRMPWIAVDKEYWFEGPAGRLSFAELFAGRRQLVLYRAFYGPE